MGFFTFFLICSGCSGLYFYPETELPFTGVWVREGLHGWHLEPQGDQMRGSVLFLHGNAGNVASHFPAYSWLAESGFHVLALDYSGFGISTGSPSFAAVEQDVAAAERWVKENLPEPHIVYGQSIGGAFARGEFDIYVIESAPSDLVEIGKEKLGWFGFLVQVLVPSGYSPLDRELNEGTYLFIHTKDDEIVPFHHSERMYEHTKAEKYFWSYPVGGHISAIYQPGFKSRFLDFVARRSD